MTPFFILLTGDSMVDYKVIKENLERLERDSILVLKDNAYNCGLINVLKIAYVLGFRHYAVVSKEEALTIIKEYSDVIVLILGKEKIIHKQIMLTVEDKTDYDFCVKNHVNFHVKIMSKMNRFGCEPNSGFYKHDLCKAIYYHIGFNEKNMILKELKRLLNSIKDIDKPIHIGGSLVYEFYPDIQKRIGMRIYENSKSLKGKIIKIFKLKSNEYLGYGTAYKSSCELLIGIVDIGYKNGLNASNKNKYVIINGKKYYLAGRKCMDYSFIIIDTEVSVNDQVEFLGNNIDINKLARMEHREVYEVFLDIK